MKKLIYILLFFPLSIIAQTDPSTLPPDLDGIQNGTETGIDCGGTTGRPCVNGAALKAFPGAEGAGKYSLGARGAGTPTLYVVTNTNRSGPGSIGEAFGWDGSADLSYGGNKFIVFRTGGTVDFNGIHPAFYGDNVTIFGQTAPADSGGFVITNGTPDFRGDHLIVQDMQFEAGDLGYRNPDGSLTGFDPNNQADGLSVYLCHDVIIDHCRIGYGVDENLTMSNAYNITFQYNLSHHPLHCAGHGDNVCHSMGGILDRSDDGSPIGGRYSFYRNYVAYANDRNYRSAKSIFEMVNNVFFGFFGQATFSSGQSFSLIGNHWEKSPNQELYNGQTVAQSNDATHGYGGKVYFADNTRNHSVNIFYDADWTNQGVIVGSAAETFTTNPPIWPSAQVQDSVLANVGPRLHKAPIHNQVIADYGIGNLGVIDTQWEVGGFTNAATGTPWPDTDSDGMDDSWEISFFGDLSQTWNGDHDNDGYLNVEEWAADLVGSSATAPTAGFSVSNISGNTTEAGGTATFTIVLNYQPTTDVVFDITSNDETEGLPTTATDTTDPIQATFTNANWATPQTVTVTGEDDALEDGNISYSITVSVNDAASDDEYDPLPDATVNVVNIDNDPTDIALTNVQFALTQIEIGTGGTVTPALTFTPSNASDQTGVWTSSNPAVATVNSSTGLVTGVSTGSATITFTANDTTNGTLSDTILINVSSTLSTRKLKSRN